MDDPADNPLLSPSTLPHGLPPFDRIRVEHLTPAFDRGFAEHLAEVAAITADPAPPTFATTVEPLERAGRLLDRAQRVLWCLSAHVSTPALQQVEADLAPRLAAHADAVLLDPALFARVDAVHRAVAAGEEQLDDEQAHVLHRLHTTMVLAGARLEESDKAVLRALNTELATRTTRFRSALLAETEDLAVHVTDLDRLDGLSDGQVSAAAAAAAARGLDGWLLPLLLPTPQPALAVLTDRSLREELLTAAQSRGRRGGPDDTRAIVLDIVRLRARRAHLLGFDTPADLVTADLTAGTPTAVAELLGRAAPVAARNARAEAEALQAAADAERDAAGLPRIELAAHDWAFHAERHRASSSVDESALRPYLEAERVLHHGVFHAAGAAFGLAFTERHDLPGWHPGVRTFEVAEADGRPVGLVLVDLYAREGKRGGAWMSSLRVQADLVDQPTPVVTCTLNVPEPGPGEPTLLTMDEVRTLFHEFGHVLHGLLARVTHPSAAGTAVPRDVVEFPSQVNEMWVLWPGVLERYAIHHETGEALPEPWVRALREAGPEGQAHATHEYLASALLDQAWHRLSPAEAEAVDDVDAFEAAALDAAGLGDPRIPPRYRSSYFSHVFSDSDYDAAYYGYLWAEVLDADAVRWFEEHGGLTRENGDHYRRHVLAVGGSRDAMAAYRAFRGRDPELQPLLVRRGLAA